jgi:branched-chain amino acid transport system substrate-binding protein
MTKRLKFGAVDRRTVVKAGAVVGLSQIAKPFVWSARAADTIKVGMVDPFTGVYAAVAQNELIGVKYAVEQINAKGGVLGREIELLVEDSANDVGIGVQKTRKLIERDGIQFLIGDVNSGIALAIAQVSNEKRVLHIVSGGHTDGITGKDCHWNVYRVCNTTKMEANCVAELLFQKYGKKWHFITPDYAFGHTLQEAAQADLKKLGGTVTGNELTPLGTTDFSAYLIKARAANPDVLLVLPQGLDMVNCLKQVAQFGIDKQIHVAGLQQELESLEAMPPEARVGIWMFEWYWKQAAAIPGLDQFIADVRKRSDGKVPTARTWFGYVTIHAYAMACEKAKTIEAKAVAKTLADLELPPEITLQPNKVYFRGGDHQLMLSSFIGELRHSGDGDPENLFKVTDVVSGDSVAPPVSETGCAMQMPA